MKNNLHANTVKQTSATTSAREWLLEFSESGVSADNLLNTLRKEFKRNNIIEEGRWETIFDQIFEVWFRCIYRAPVSNETRASAKARSEEMLTSVMKQFERIVKQRAEVILMEMVMPNGKQLGDCTGTDIRNMAKTYGPFMVRLAKRIKPRQHVRNAATEEQLKELYETSGLNNQKPRKSRQ